MIDNNEDMIKNMFTTPFLHIGEITFFFTF